MSASDKTHCSQQLQHKGFSPVPSEEKGVRCGSKQKQTFLSGTQMHSPGILAVETEGDLVNTAWVSHHLVKTRLDRKEKHKWLPSRELMHLRMKEGIVFEKNYFIRQ